MILPIAGLVLTFVATYELIQMLLEKNNMHEFDVANIYKWMFKTACAIFILSNPAFDGEFDLWIDGIRIEVKACRANSKKGSGSLASRAYLHTEAHNAGFKYHYQQLKPSCCDVFIWIGTCRDTLLYWVLSSNELLETGKLGSQHRNEHTGTAGNAVFEGQVFMTEDELFPFAVKEENILNAVYAKSQIKNR